MSGWAGMIRFDGAPLDLDLFQSMTASLAFRGPDRTGVWTSEQAAFAHTLLATTPEARYELQPVVQNDVVFAGDLRIDAGVTDRDDGVTDPEAALDAYLREGESFVDKLVGDFSFAIWDARARTLLLARDPFARRPLFVGHHGGAWLVTNNLPTLLAVPGLARDLDDAAIGDFLLFGRNLHAQRTTFAHIERVPAAHLMTVTADAARLRRYWTIPLRDEPRVIRPVDAYAEFRDVLTRSVADRARADRVVLSLSGGLDSNAIGSLLARLPGRPHVTALTTVWQEVNDPEGSYAAIAAKAYGFDHEIDPIGCAPFAGWDDPRVRGWEPTDEPCTLPFFDFVRQAASHARVILTGEGADPLLYTSHDYFFRLLTRLRWVRFVRDAAGYALSRRRRPPLCLRSQLQLAAGHTPGLPDYPDWINPGFESRLDLRARWAEVLEGGGPRRHAYRHDAWRILDNPAWSRQFEATDAGSSGQALEWLSPYLDVRVVEFLFSLPPMPHFANKDIVREALRGWMPEAIRTRPKTPLPGDPAAIGFARSPEKALAAIENAVEMDRYVDRRRTCLNIEHGGSQYRTSQHAFTVSLALWLSLRETPQSPSGSSSIRHLA